MDSFEFNKIAGAVLATALGVMALSILSEVLFAPAEAVQPGYVVAGVDPGDDGHGGGGGGSETAAADLPPLAVRLASADVAAGERSMGKCKACHTFAEGDPKKTPGPNLWNIVEAPIAHQEGFGYSEAFVKMHETGATWTYDNLDAWLENPKAFIPGTAMTFAGLKKPDERANVIAYLRTLSNSPVPLPAPEATATAPAEAPAAAEPAPAPAPDAPATQVPAGEPATPPATEAPAPH